MPNVAGKKFPYTKAGIAAAKKMADKKLQPLKRKRSLLLRLWARADQFCLRMDAMSTLTILMGL